MQTLGPLTSDTLFNFEAIVYAYLLLDISASAPEEVLDR